ncbi:hypothetical protein KKD62_02280 [Patescibacteria group bacterium]|nr:hypothetical protein [Patescibacteria group bacterium]MBU1931696.1 hypothetical protein [Patescibacteria group bacterium]
MKKFKTLILIILGLVLSFGAVSFIYGAQWEGKNNFNLAFWLNQNGGIISLQPQNQQAVIVVFPPETILPVAKGFGDYRAKAVYALGEQEKLGGGYLWQLSVERFLGLMTDGYLINLKPRQTLKKSLLVNGVFLSLFKPGELASLDALRAWWFLIRLRPDQLEIINLVDSGVAVEKRLANGDLAYEATEEKIDQLLRRFFVETTAANQNLRLLVFNATDQLGAGSWFSRVLNNHGGLVVHITNAPPSEHSVVEATQEPFFDKFLVEKTIKKFNFDTKVVNSIFQGRGDVGYILAEDFKQKYFVND